MTKVIVAINEYYSDNNGAWEVAVLWDGTSISFAGSCYEVIPNNFAPWGSKEDKLAAAEWFANNKLDVGYKDYLGVNTYIGCVVELKRSKAAPNGVPLTVVDYIPETYSEFLGHKISAKVVVDVNGKLVKVSPNCVNNVIKGRYPHWKPKF